MRKTWAVFEIAPAKVLPGAVRLHGLASSPTPDTQVRVACACAGAATESVPTTAAAASREIVANLIVPSWRTDRFTPRCRELLTPRELQKRVNRRAHAIS